MAIAPHQLNQHVLGSTISAKMGDSQWPCTFCDHSQCCSCRCSLRRTVWSCSRSWHRTFSAWLYCRLGHGQRPFYWRPDACLQHTHSHAEMDLALCLDGMTDESRSGLYNNTTEITALPGRSKQSDSAASTDIAMLAQLLSSEEGVTKHWESTGWRQESKDTLGKIRNRADLGEKFTGIECSLRNYLPWPGESSASVLGEFFLLICVDAVVSVIGTPACHGDAFF
jgi:hypothetical protein